MRRYQRRKSNGLLRRAIKSWRRGDIVRAGQLALNATEADETNGQAFHVLALALERMGHLHKALPDLRRRLSELEPGTIRICLLNLGLTAWNMKHAEPAGRMFRPVFIEANRGLAARLQNLGMIGCELRRCPRRASIRLRYGDLPDAGRVDFVEFARDRARRRRPRRRSIQFLYKRPFASIPHFLAAVSQSGLRAVASGASG